MKQFQHILFALAFLLSISTSIAQPIKTNTLEQMLETAAEALDEKDYYNAIEYFEMAYKEERNYNLVPVVAKSYMELRDYKRATKWFDRIFRKGDVENNYLEHRLAYGQALKQHGEYSLALEQFATFLSLTEDDVARAIAVREVEGINQYNSLDENIEVAIKPADTNVNSGSSESRPIEYTDGTLYFSSFKTNKKLDMKEVDSDYHMKIYTSTATDGSFAKPTALSMEINREEFHTSNPSFSADGREMYFTRSLLEDANLIYSKIYVSYKTDEGWKPPLELETVNGDWIAKNPCVGELFGQRVLIFSSDLEGGKGGFDLYYSNILGEGNYSTPTNLGDVINTSEHEITPFFQDGVLYFSSNGLPTIGGYDIFQTTWDGVAWSAPKNMGKGYNSSVDDMYLTFSKEGNRGYLVSNREYDQKKKIQSETCCDDIYTLNVRDLVIDLIATVSGPDGPLSGANIKLENLTLKKNNIENKKETTTNKFNFLLDQDNKYKMVVSAEGYYPDSLEFNTYGILDDFTVEKSMTLKEKPKVVVAPPKEVEIVTINEAIRLNNIFYDYDDDKILPRAEQDLRLIMDLMSQYPTMVIELSSHTDARGGGRYNQSLSQRRANSAKKWLTQRGVAGDRIEAKGYGESVILNQCVEGVKCSDEDHQINRRTEFKILSGPTTIEIRREVPKEYNGGRQSFGVMDSVPVMKFDDDRFNLGAIARGDVKRMLYKFENVGLVDLNIELVTACKCTQIDWTKGNIAPGEKGEIFVEYDSKDDVGVVSKTIDIIANTDPIVVQVFFDTNVEDKKKPVSDSK